MSRSGRAFLGSVAGALAVEYVPSIATLGSWTRLRSLPGGLVRWSGDPGTGAVAITFDDGPDPEGTPAVLDVLGALGLPATFFCLGAQVDARPELVGRLVTAGHTVATHGYHHAHHLAHGPRWVHADLGRAVRSLADCGVVPRWYRPTYGQLTGATLLAARRHGLRTVLWSAWGREWSTTDPNAVAERVTARLGPGAVVLLHDSDRFGSPGMWRTALAALPLLARELGRRGLRAVTLDELVS